jgi:hypothetical protein
VTAAASHNRSPFAAAAATTTTTTTTKSTTVAPASTSTSPSSSAVAGDLPPPYQLSITQASPSSAAAAATATRPPASVPASASSPAAPASAVGKEMDVSLPEIARRVRESKLHSNDCTASGKDIIAFLGNTGTGKTTTILYLSGANLEIRKEPFTIGNFTDCREYIVANPPVPHFDIGKGDASTTKSPQLLFSESLQRYLVDFAGVCVCARAVLPCTPFSGSSPAHLRFPLPSFLSPGFSDSSDDANFKIASAVTIGDMLQECKSVVPVILIDCRSISAFHSFSAVSVSNPLLSLSTPPLSAPPLSTLPLLLSSPSSSLFFFPQVVRAEPICGPLLSTIERFFSPVDKYVGQPAVPLHAHGSQLDGEQAEEQHRLPLVNSPDLRAALRGPSCSRIHQKLYEAGDDLTRSAPGARIARPSSSPT